MYQKYLKICKYALYGKYDIISIYTSSIYTSHKGEICMSLYVGLNKNNFMNQYKGYMQWLPMNGIPRTFNWENSKTSNLEDSQDTRLMKRIGVIECITCKNRKYVDGSNDPGVSFKTPAHISPESSGAAVMSHEQEHVSRAISKARAEGRRVVSRSVRVYTAVCPECGRVYTSGGKTTTTTKADNTDYFGDKMKKSLQKHYGKYIDVRV